MNKYFSSFLHYIFIFFFSSIAFADAPFPAQMLMNIYQSPMPMKADNKYFLVYEIYLTNYMKSAAKLTSFEIAGDNKSKLWTLSDLTKSIQSRGNETKNNTFNFLPGETKTIYVWLPFTEDKNIPKKLIHHLSIDSSFKDKENIFDFGAYPITVESSHPIVISSPLRGKNWLAGNGPSNTSDHRRTALIINGKPYYAQRYAIDFVKIGKDGKTYSGDLHKNTNYHCYNDDLLAVADGTIVALQDGIPENIPNSNKPAVPINLKSLPGNYIVMDIGNGHYAGYAHIIPGSFKVKLGDHVTRNQVLAKLGNSGNSSEPHLHFQITNNKIFIEANGVPYAFDHFSAHPTTLIDDPTGSMRIKLSNDQFREYSNQLVLENALINFE